MHAGILDVAEQIEARSEERPSLIFEAIVAAVRAYVALVRAPLDEDDKALIAEL